MAEKLKLGEYQKPNKDRTKESIEKYVKGMREKKGGKALSSRNIRKINLQKGGMAEKRSSFMGGGIAYKGGGRAMKRGGKI